MYFKRTTRGGKVGLRVTRNSVPSRKLDEAEVDKRWGSGYGRGYKSWHKRYGRGLRTGVTKSMESVFGRVTRSGTAKLGLRITRGGKVGLRVTRGGMFGTRITNKDSDYSDDVPEFGKRSGLLSSIIKRYYLEKYYLKLLENVHKFTKRISSTDEIKKSLNVASPSGVLGLTGLKDEHDKSVFDFCKVFYCF